MRLIIDCLIYKKNKAFGYQEYLFNLLNYFHVNRHLFKAQEIVVVCDKAQRDDFNVFSNKFTIKSFNAKSKIRQIIFQNLLKLNLKLTDEDVILYTYNYSSLFRQAKSILVVHDLLFKRKNYLPNTLIRLQRSIFIPISLKISDKIVAISLYTKNDILTHYKVKESKIKTIYNYFDFNKFHPIIKEKIVSIPETYLSSYILSVASMVKHKNIITLLKAFKTFTEKNHNTNLVIVGSSSNMLVSDKLFLSELPTNIRNRILITGDVSNDELGFLYSNCECFVLPTLFEGLGMPIVEALYFGAPLVLSDIEICHEVSEGMAIFFSPLDHQKLSNILIFNDYKKLLYLKKTKVLEKFNEKNTSNKYIDLINNKNV